MDSIGGFNGSSGLNFDRTYPGAGVGVASPGASSESTGDSVQLSDESREPATAMSMAQADGADASSMSSTLAAIYGGRANAQNDTTSPRTQVADGITGWTYYGAKDGAELKSARNGAIVETPAGKPKDGIVEGTRTILPSGYGGFVK